MPLFYCANIPYIYHIYTVFSEIETALETAVALALLSFRETITTYMRGKPLWYVLLEI